MPLSEHEQKLLEQMEQQLLADDPRFATSMREPRRVSGGNRRRAMIGVTGVVVGLGLVVLYLVNGGIGYAIAAVVFMFAGLIYALTGAQSTAGPVGSVGPDGRVHAPRAGARRGGSSRGNSGHGRQTGHGRGGARPSGTFMQRLEQRWDRRRDDR